MATDSDRRDGQSDSPGTDVAPNEVSALLEHLSALHSKRAIAENAYRRSQSDVRVTEARRFELEARYEAARDLLRSAERHAPAAFRVLAGPESPIAEIYATLVRLRTELEALEHDARDLHVEVERDDDTLGRGFYLRRRADLDEEIGSRRHRIEALQLALLDALEDERIDAPIRTFVSYQRAVEHAESSLASEYRRACDKCDSALEDHAKAHVALSALEAEIAATNDRIVRATTSDPLTAVGNRLAYEDAISCLQPRAGVVLIDVDRFKEVNDTLGHPDGDRLLRELAQFLRRTCGPRDRVFRIGGDEFAVILEPVTGEELSTRIHRFCLRWRESNPITTISIGSTCRRISEDPSETVSRADAALYHAKREGRGRARFVL